MQSIPRTTFLLIFILSLVMVHAVENSIADIQLFSEMMSINSAAAPRVFGNYIIFTYETKKHVRSVYALFEHEQFQKFHHFNRIERSGKHIFLLALRIPQHEFHLRYRYVVDSTWTNDPSNPNTAVDKHNELLSEFIIPTRYRLIDPAPAYSPEKNTVTFRLNLEQKNQHMLRTVDSRFVAVRELPKRNIYLAGSFNNWDPYLYPLQQSNDNPLVYTITIRLNPGRYYYYFVIDGTRVLDPLHNNYARSETHGYLVSAYTVQ